MHLRLDVISERLSSFCKISELNMGSGAPVLYEFPLLYRSGMRFEANRLYIANVDDLPPDQWLGMRIGLIVSGIPSEAYVGQGCSVLSVEPVVSSAELFSYVAEIFWKFKQWENQVHKLLAKHACIQEFLEVTYPLVQNPLWVIGHAGRPVAHVEESENEAYARANAFTGYVLPLDQLLFNQSLPEISAHGRDLFERETTANGQKYVCMNRLLLDHDERMMGFLVLVEHLRPLNQSDRQIINFLADILEKSLVQNREVTGSQPPNGCQLFQDLINGVNLSTAEVELRMAAEGFSEGESFICLRLLLNYVTLSMPVDTICWNINAETKDICALYYDSSIVLFVRQSSSEHVSRDLPEGVIQLISNGGFRAGVSYSFSDVKDAKLYYEQARLALNMGIRHDPERAYYFFSDYAMSYILQQCTSTLPAHMLCMEGILKLQKMDAENDSEYCRTLRIYYKNKMNAVRTAEELYIHRSTLTYRLNRIREAVGVELEDYENQLYAMISLELL